MTARPHSPDRAQPLSPWLALAALLPAVAPAQDPVTTFRNRGGTFQLELPAGWRQLAPNEARALAAFPAAPARLCLVQPNRFYAIGPVDAWLAGDFSGPWLYVVEQEHEWYVDDEFAANLRAMWDAEGRASGHRHDLRDIRRAAVGTQAVDAVLAVHLDTPLGERPAVQSLDVHVPAGGRQLTLSFCCRPEDFAAALPAFERYLATLTFARRPRGQASLGDRLWTPLIAGALVGALLLVLHHHTRRRR